MQSSQTNFRTLPSASFLCSLLPCSAPQLLATVNLLPVCIHLLLRTFHKRESRCVFTDSISLTCSHAEGRVAGKDAVLVSRMYSPLPGLRGGLTAPMELPAGPRLAEPPCELRSSLLPFLSLPALPLSSSLCGCRHPSPVKLLHTDLSHKACPQGSHPGPRQAELSRAGTNWAGARM